MNKKTNDKVEAIKQYLRSQPNQEVTFRDEPWMLFNAEYGSRTLRLGYYFTVNGDTVPDPLVTIRGEIITMHVSSGGSFDLDTNDPYFSEFVDAVFHRHFKKRISQ